MMNLMSLSHIPQSSTIRGGTPQLRFPCSVITRDRYCTLEHHTPVCAYP